jgi:hypothetical protein
VHQSGINNAIEYQEELEMAVTQLTRWSGGNRDALVPLGKQAKAIQEKLGGEFRLGQIHTGPHAGQWLTSVRYPDWETYGKAQQALASDTAFQKLMADALATAQVADRAVIVGIDI